MSERYKVLDSTCPTFITLTITDWIDLLIRPQYCKILDESLNFCSKNKGLKVHAYVYMGSHMHLIVSSEKHHLADLIRDLKTHTSKELIKAIQEYPESRRDWLMHKFWEAANRTQRGKKYKVWKDGFHPVILDTAHKIKQRVNYIHKNPVKAEWVFHERDWVNSSYNSYEQQNYLSNIALYPLY